MHLINMTSKFFTLVLLAIAFPALATDSTAVTPPSIDYKPWITEIAIFPAKQEGGGAGCAGTTLLGPRTAFSPRTGRSYFFPAGSTIRVKMTGKYDITGGVRLCNAGKGGNTGIFTIYRNLNWQYADPEYKDSFIASDMVVMSGEGSIAAKDHQVKSIDLNAGDVVGIAITGYYPSETYFTSAHLRLDLK